jgi:hypothetical protein
VNDTIKPVIGAAAAVVILVGGMLLVATFATGGRTPDVARIRCAAAGPVAEDPEVRPQADGVHLAFESDDGAQLYDVHAAGWAVGTSLGGRIVRGVTEAELSVPPGRVEVRCVNDAGGFDANAPKTELTVIDPDRLWVSPELTCGAATDRLLLDAGPAPTSPDPERLALATLDGLGAGDVLVKPGYPDTQWHGHLMLVLRLGRPIATVTQYADDGRWRIDVEVCPGNHIAGD